MQPPKVKEPTGAEIRARFNTSQGFFGQELDHEAPIVVCDCIAFLRHRGLYEEGIFRVTGNIDVVEELKELYDSHFPTHYEKENKNRSILNEYHPRPGVADIASLLKSFLRELKEPLIPNETAVKMLQVIASGWSEDKETEELSKCVKEIPRPRRECFGLIVSFLREVVSLRKHNQMSPANLGTCFVLCFLRGTDTVNHLTLVSHGSVMIRKLIELDVKLRLPSLSSFKNNTKYKTLEELQQLAPPLPVRPDSHNSYNSTSAQDNVSASDNSYARKSHKKDKSRNKSILRPLSRNKDKGKMTLKPRVTSKGKFLKPKTGKKKVDPHIAKLQNDKTGKNTSWVAAALSPRSNYTSWMERKARPKSPSFLGRTNKEIHQAIEEPAKADFNELPPPVPTSASHRPDNTEYGTRWSFLSENSNEAN